jgi:hypothetical protein
LKELAWDFLAPNRAHNRCDAAAAHFKRKVNSFIDDYYALSEISHLAFAVSTLTNSYVIEVTEFPTVVECTALDAFMRDAFRVEYAEPEMRVDKCGHKCYGTNCGHAGGCCQRTDEIEMV